MLRSLYVMLDERLQHREALQGFSVYPKPYTVAELLQTVKDVLK